MHLLTLPNELLHQITSTLPLTSHISLQLTCQDLHSCLSHLTLSRFVTPAHRFPSALSALHYASKTNHIPLLTIALKKGFKCTSYSDHGDTPLHLASFQGHTEVVRILLDHGASINAPDDHPGRTPLHLAVERAHEDVVRLLLERGADVNMPDWGGAPPMVSWVRMDTNFWKMSDEVRARVFVALLEWGAAVEGPAGGGVGPGYLRRIVRKEVAYLTEEVLEVLEERREMGVEAVDGVVALLRGCRILTKEDLEAYGLDDMGLEAPVRVVGCALCDDLAAEEVGEVEDIEDETHVEPGALPLPPLPPKEKTSWEWRSQVGSIKREIVARGKKLGLSGDGSRKFKVVIRLKGRGVWFPSRNS